MIYWFVTTSDFSSSSRVDCVCVYVCAFLGGIKNLIDRAHNSPKGKHQRYLCRISMQMTFYIFQKIFYGRLSHEHLLSHSSCRSCYSLRVRILNAFYETTDDDDDDMKRSNQTNDA